MISAKIETTFRKLGAAEYRPVSESELEVSFCPEQEIPGLGYHCAISVKNPTGEAWQGVIHFELEVPGEKSRFFMPAFLYGRNRGDSPGYDSPKLYPRMQKDSCVFPNASWWMVRGDRLSHPVSMLYDGQRVCGISASPYLVNNGGVKKAWGPDVAGEFAGFNGFSCRLGESSRVGFTLGYENAPALYVIDKIFYPEEFTEENCLTLLPGETLNCPVMVYDFSSQDVRGIHKVIRDVYERFHQMPRKGAEPAEAVEDLSQAIFEDSYLPEQKNYSTMISFHDGVVDKQPHTSISWTGGAEVAVPVLMAAIRTGRQDMREQAISCIQNIVDHSLNPHSGLPYDSYANEKWSCEGWWYGLLAHKGHSSYLVGEAIYYILKAYQFEKETTGVIHSNWLSFAEQVITHMDSTRDVHGEYPHIWSEKTGEGIEYDSFSGCWCLAASLMLLQVKGVQQLPSYLLESEDHYYRCYVKKAECYGTPHDTFKAIDAEGILAYCKVTRMLHDFTKDVKYLEHLTDALDYEFSFKFCYNVPVQINPLKKTGWSSCGGTVTSTANPHIHPMSNCVIDELLYAYHQTGDKYIESRMKDAVLWGLQTYNRFDGEYDFGKKGWMSERFCYSQGLLSEKYENGKPSSTWFYFLPWGASNILEGLCGNWWETERL